MFAGSGRRLELARTVNVFSKESVQEKQVLKTCRQKMSLIDGEAKEGVKGICCIWLQNCFLLIQTVMESGVLGNCSD